MDADISHGSDAYELISIGLPVWNGGRYLRATLDSLLEQSFANFEIVISDNFSSDETPVILAEYAEKDGRIRYFRQDTLLPVVENFEFVLAHSRGKYFMWAAADDYFDRDWLLRLTPHLGDDVAAFGQLQHVDAQGAPKPYLANSSGWDLTSSCAILRRVKFFIAPEALGKASLIYGLYPREILMRFYERILRSGTAGNYADVVFVWEMLREVRIASVKGVSLYKRVHAGAVSSAAAPTVYAQKSLRRRLEARRLNYAQKLSLAGLGGHLRYCTLPEKFLYLALVPLKMLRSYILIAMRSKN